MLGGQLDGDQDGSSQGRDLGERAAAGHERDQQGESDGEAP